MASKLKNSWGWFSGACFPPRPATARRGAMLRYLGLAPIPSRNHHGFFVLEAFRFQLLIVATMGKRSGPSKSDGLRRRNYFSSNFLRLEKDHEKAFWPRSVLRFLKLCLKAHNLTKFRSGWLVGYAELELTPFHSVSSRSCRNCFRFVRLNKQIFPRQGKLMAIGSSSGAVKAAARLTKWLFPRTQNKTIFKPTRQTYRELRRIVQNHSTCLAETIKSSNYYLETLPFPS